jgi:hypothetical protein
MATNVKAKAAKNEAFVGLGPKLRTVAAMEPM